MIEVWTNKQENKSISVILMDGRVQFVRIGLEIVGNEIANSHSVVYLSF